MHVNLDTLYSLANFTKSSVVMEFTWEEGRVLKSPLVTLELMKCKVSNLEGLGSKSTLTSTPDGTWHERGWEEWKEGRDFREGKVEDRRFIKRRGEGTRIS